MSTTTEIFPVAQRKSILMSNTDKIQQTVMTGSVFLALDANFFTAEALLRWLTTVDITLRCLISYKAVCMRIPVNDQYMNDGFHFLTKKPGYTSIALGFGLNPEIPDRKDSNPMDNNPLLARICEELIAIQGTSVLRLNSSFILTGGGTSAFIQANLGFCFNARNFPNLNISPREINVGLVEADWTAKFRYNEKLPQLILRRITKLQSQAPLYYAGVAYKEYYQVAVKLSKDKLLIQLSRDDLTTFNTFFPNIIDSRILSYSDLGYKVALLGNDVAGYVLGFPIQNMIPNDDQIHMAVEILTNEGTEKYSQNIKDYVKNTYIPIPPFPCGNIIYANDSDVMMDDIDQYGPFDIVSYQVGNHIYRLTRAEFDKLVESKKNPWTNDWFPPTVLSTIIARSTAAKELGLPPAGSIIELLTRLDKGTLFTHTETVQAQPQQLAIINLSDIFGPFFDEMRNGQMQNNIRRGLWNPGLPIDDNIGQIIGNDAQQMEWVPEPNDIQGDPGEHNNIVDNQEHNNDQLNPWNPWSPLDDSDDSVDPDPDSVDPDPDSVDPDPDSVEYRYISTEATSMEEVD